MSDIKTTAPLEKINVLTKSALDGLDLTQYPNEIFGTTDETDWGSP